MGTRSKIILSSKSENLTLVLYKHWDGYPSDNLNMFLEAFKTSKTMEEFKAACGKYYEREDMEEGRGPFNPTVFFKANYSLQGDLEYFYMVDLDAKNIDVFGKGYGTEREHYAAGKILPMTEINSYREDCKLAYRTRLTEILTGLDIIGVTINGGESDQSLIEGQLLSLKKDISKLENKLYDIDNERSNLELNRNFLSKEFFLKMGSSQIKDFLELSGIKVTKVTKCKEVGAFNVYLGDNKGFKDSQSRTPWQLINWASHYLNLKLEIKHS